MFMQRNVAYVAAHHPCWAHRPGPGHADEHQRDAGAAGHERVYSNLRKQCVWLASGAVACVFLSRYDYQKVVAVCALGGGLRLWCCWRSALCRMSACGSTVRRAGCAWTGWTYQPSEFAKLALILFLAWWLGKKQRVSGDFIVQGFVWPVACTLPRLLLMVCQAAGSRHDGDHADRSSWPSLFCAGARNMIRPVARRSSVCGLVGIRGSASLFHAGTLCALDWPFSSATCQHTMRRTGIPRSMAAIAGAHCAGFRRSDRAWVSATAGRKCTGCPR